VVFGGVDIKTQTPHLRNGVEILVATPGRLLDHIEQKSVQLNQVQMLVLDEADRMLDMGFMPDLKRILALLPKQRQNLMFSATFSNEIKKLSSEFLVAPTLIEVARSNATSANVTQKVYLVGHGEKHDLLAHLLRAENAKQALVFTKTKLTASRIARQLEREGFAADAIHGDKSQLERIQALDAFKSGKVTVLIATDVAARGLDIDQLPMVINYEIPSAAEDYVHRIGRTGRAGAFGNAISLVSPDEEKYLAEIEKLIKCQIERATPPAKPAPRAVERPVERHAPRADYPVRSHTPQHSVSKRPVHDAWFNKPYEPSVSTQVKVAPVVVASTKPASQIPALFMRRKPAQTDE
jgi:superfamily II DNA/RNA helicase